MLKEIKGGTKRRISTKVLLKRQSFCLVLKISPAKDRLDNWTLNKLILAEFKKVQTLTKQVVSKMFILSRLKLMTKSTQSLTLNTKIHKTKTIYCWQGIPLTLILY